MGNLGDVLRQAREGRGVTLAEVEEATHILQSHLIALESGDYARLPAPVFVRGFLRSYASYLGLNPDEILHLYHGEAGAWESSAPSSLPVVREPIIQPRPRHRWTIGSTINVVALASIAFLIALVVIVRIAMPTMARLFSPTIFLPSSPLAAAPETPTPLPSSVPTIAEIAAPSPSPSATATPTPAIWVDVAIVQRSWISVTVDGVPTFSGILEPGDIRTWTGRQAITLIAGNAGGTLVTVNGVFRGPLGGPGQVVNVTFPAPGTPAPTRTTQP